MLETHNIFHTSEDTIVETTAKIIRIDGNKVYLDQTLFYAESGGQEYDLGTLICSGKTFEVTNVQYEKESIWKTAHYLAGDQEEILRSLHVGDNVQLKLNFDRRMKLSAYHTASHLLFMAAEKVRPGIQNQVIGCHIKEDSARFDFVADEKFSPNELQDIELYMNDLVKKKLDITVGFESEENNKRVWKCLDAEIPCGGTHLNNTALLSDMIKVKRKGIGKGKERLICSTEHILKG